MPIREFTDSSGVNWRVWPTRPQQRGVHPDAFEGGWLTFECGSIKKRIVPIPDGWDELDNLELERLCKMAEEFRAWATRRSSTSSEAQQ